MGVCRVHVVDVCGGVWCLPGVRVWAVPACGCGCPCGVCVCPYGAVRCDVPVLVQVRGVWLRCDGVAAWPSECRALHHPHVQLRLRLVTRAVRVRVCDRACVLPRVCVAAHVRGHARGRGCVCAAVCARGCLWLLVRRCATVSVACILSSPCPCV